MEILLSRLAEGGERFIGEEPAEVLDLELGETIVSVGPMRYDLMVASVVGDELLVRGKVWCETECLCSRCADPFDLTVGENPYVRSYELQNETESVDLTPDMREATLLAFPAYPVCRPACAGLCSMCGANFNAGSCDCQPAQDARWGGLDGLSL
ncbi:MAG: DUF177 domain-containing protein [Lentisphaerae bacterium]|nr:DUF177 domain-containing protein [Lentisphaerota bacterium]